MSPRPSRSAQGAATALAAAMMLLLTVRLAGSVTLAPEPATGGQDGQRRQVRYVTEGRHMVHEITGVVPAGPSRLVVETSIGSVRVRRAAGDQTAYTVRLRAAGDDPAEARRRIDRMIVGASRSGDLLHFTGFLPAAPGQDPGLTAEFEIDVPAAMTVIEVGTGAGDIDAVGAPGRIVLTTRAGAVTGRDMEGPVEIETRGGRIEVAGVRRAARLSSAGGGVLVETVQGPLAVRTSGGDVRVGRAGDTVQVESGGGNVRIENAGGTVRVATGGGDIDIGDARGEVTAATGGGGIRVRSAAGVRCETAAGPIVLGAVDGPIRAISSAGSIRAVLQAGALAADSDIQTWHGDVIVSLPEDLAVTIRALVDNPIGRSIQSDFPLAIDRDVQAVGRPLEVGEARIGGGGPLLKIRTIGGRILIQKASQSPGAGDARPRAD